MKEQFVPYEQALGLKELGFNEECISRYWTNIFQLRSPENFNSENSKIDSVSAPLWQQAFDWFRDKGFVVQLDLPDYVTVEGFDDLVYYFKISDYDGWRGGLRNTYKSVSYDTLEEERLECLKELIQILKKQN